MVSSTGLNHLISFYKKVQVHFGQNNFNGEKLHLICGDKDPGFGLFKLYSELENEKIIFTAFLNVDHVFSGNTELFIKLPEKYLF